MTALVMAAASLLAPERAMAQERALDRSCEPKPFLETSSSAEFQAPPSRLGTSSFHPIIPLGNFSNEWGAITEHPSKRTERFAP